MFQVPQNVIPKVSNYSDKSGDFVETFSLELVKNYGSLQPNRMKLITSSATQSDIEIPVGFAFYNGAYRMITDDFVYTGGDEINDPFTKDESSNAPSGDITESLSDVEIFNGSMYVSGNDEVFKLAGSTWSKPVTTQLTSARPHLMTSMGQGDNAYLYITDDYDQIHSISTSDVISATGTATFDFQLGGGWSISMLEAGTDAVWVGFVDAESGRGLVFEWDGVTENVYSRRIPLNAGVAAGCIVDGIPYVMDLRGRLLRYSGYTFVEVDKLPFDLPFTPIGARGQTNLRFIHPNGMTSTDRNTILINVSNETEVTDVYQNKAPAGVYEYDPQIGLYHKFAYSTSAIGATSFTELGMPRVSDVGAIFFSRSTDPTSTSNGNILAGAQYFTTPSTTAYGIFTNDTLKTTQGYGYFVTPKFFSSSIQDTWKEVYAVYDEIINNADKIVVKYRTREKNSVSASSNWLNSTQFTTTTNVSTFEVGDEVTILEGVGAGQTMHITKVESSSSTYTITIDENPLSSTGAFEALFQNWKKLGEADNDATKQWHKFTITEKNVSPWVQIKVLLYLTDTDFHRVQVENSKHINT